MTITSEALRLNATSKEALQRSSRNSNIHRVSKRTSPPEGNNRHPRKETPDVMLSKSATVGCLPSLENGMIVWSTIYLFDSGTRKDTHSNYLTIPHMGQSGSHLATVVNECMKTWISKSPKMDEQHSAIFGKEILPLKDSLFDALTKDTASLSIFDKITITFRTGKASKELTSILTGEFDELFLRVSPYKMMCVVSTHDFIVFLVFHVH